MQNMSLKVPPEDGCDDLGSCETLWKFYGEWYVSNLSPVEMSMNQISCQAIQIGGKLMLWCNFI